VSAAQKDLAEVYGRIPGGPDVVRVEVLAQQWAWNFRLAGNDRAFGTPDDVVSLNVLRVPEGRPVVLNLRSKDVLHAFFVPALRLKHDAHPAGTTRTWFAVREPGTYEIACSQFCGFAHYRMRGTLEVLPPQAYARWLAEASSESAFRFDPANREAAWGWEFVP
jgi:cytochrome c oxidase subunit 2